jgi:tetratricopeptide (TPR) repeat protein
MQNFTSRGKSKSVILSLTCILSSILTSQEIILAASTTTDGIKLGNVQYCPSGRRVHFLDLNTAKIGNTQKVAVVLRYQSEFPDTKMDQVAAEADDILDGNVAVADKTKLNIIVLCAFFKQIDPNADKSKPRFISYELHRDGHDNWQCTTDKRVGAGTPAKAAYKEGLLLTKNKEFAEALIEFDKSLTLDPKFSPAYSDRAGVRLLFGHPEKCLPDCDQAIKLNPQNGTAYANRGFANFKLGQFDKAIVDFTNALDRGFVNADVLKQRAIAFDKVGKPDLSVGDLSRAIRLEPKNPALITMRSAAFAKLSQIDTQQAAAMNKTAAPAK